MGKFLTEILLVTSAAILLTACNTAGCTDNQNSIPLAGFYGSDGSSVSIDSLAVWGVGAPCDSLLLSSTERASQIYLPLRSSQAASAFCFAYRTEELDKPELQDTLTLIYSTIPWFISEDCGAGYRYEIDRMLVTHHLIDSVAIVDSLVTNIDREILKIYFRTAAEGDSEQ